MKIIYILNQRIPTEKAYGVQVSQMCQALSDAGNTVTLLAPTRLNKTPRDFFDFYGVRRNFNFELVWSPDFYFPGSVDRIAFWIKSFISSVVLAFVSVLRGADLYYCRDELPALWLLLMGRRVIYEAHRVSSGRSFFYKIFSALGVHVVAISGGVRKSLSRYGFKESAVVVAPDGVNLEEFNSRLTKEEARSGLSVLQGNERVVMYVGHLYDWKGVDLLASASGKLKGVKFVILGGGDLGGYHGNVSSIIKLPQVAHAEVPKYMRAADILVLPNKDDGGISTFYTSPLKMFEYMASGRPIVATKLPSIQEVLNESNSILVESNNADALVEGIKKLLDDPALGERLAQKALHDVEQYIWNKRVEKIIGFVTK